MIFNSLHNKIETTLGILILIAVFLLVTIFILIAWTDLKKLTLNDNSRVANLNPGFSYFSSQETSLSSLPTILSGKDSFSLSSIKKFKSEQDFKDYLIKAQNKFVDYSLGGQVAILPLQLVEEQGSQGVQKETSISPQRVSQTNVQTPGVDEPDIVKTDGRKIYFSQGWGFSFFPELMVTEPSVVQEKILPPSLPVSYSTKVVRAFPPDQMFVDFDIKETGNLLLVKEKNILVIFSGNKILGYDVLNPADVKQRWEVKLDAKSTIVASRLYKGKIYLVTKNIINQFTPCPIKPLMVNDVGIEVECSNIYHPAPPIPVDVTFIAMVLDPSSGKIEEKISFVGSSGDSVVYVSEKALYITYSLYEDLIKILADFLEKRASDIVPSSVLLNIKKLAKFDIGQRAKIIEFTDIFRRYISSLDEDEVLKIENELVNRWSDYYKLNIRELEKSGIIKIPLDSFNINTLGQVAGFPLNQFSLDEYQDNLRIAVTVGDRINGFLGQIGEWTRERYSLNDVYILDKDLRTVGSVRDLGVNERIYSARFVGNKAYLVTFRQIDPFYVLDLSNPRMPALKGQLKIPGYSSYLHPIDESKILGVGQDQWRVKISLFDVSQADNPIETAKYILQEGWSEVMENHHAFLLDNRHKIFFIPAGQGGYIFSYKDEKLTLVKAISGVSVKRAVYIDDYLYIIGDDKIVVFDETNWKKVKELSL